MSVPNIADEIDETEAEIEIIWNGSEAELGDEEEVEDAPYIIFWDDNEEEADGQQPGS